MNKLIEEYARVAIQLGTATEEGDSEATNLAYDQLDELFRNIVAEGLRLELLQLLDHRQPAVRSKTAFHTLAVSPERAEAVLAAVSKESGLVGFSAGMTLEEWRKGDLKPAS